MRILQQAVIGFVLLTGGPALALGQSFDSAAGQFQLETIVEGLEYPWSLAFLPDGSALATERPGRLRIIRNGELTPDAVKGVPDVAAPGQGGLFDVTLHPNFASNNTLFRSYAHRSPEGVTVHPQTGDLWTHEHGPRGGDEVNILRAGTNYGWPDITYGIGYSGLPITLDTHKDGMAQPLHYWDPSIAPSGMAFYSGDQFPQWQDDLFVGALKLRKLVRLRMNNQDEVIDEEDLLSELDERIRDVWLGPAGALWLLTDTRHTRKRAS